MSQHNKPPGVKRNLPREKGVRPLNLAADREWQRLETGIDLTFTWRERFRILFGAPMKVTSRILLDDKGEVRRTDCTKELS